MRHRFSLLLLLWVLTACALPIGPRPTPAASIPTAEPATAEPATALPDESRPSVPRPTAAVSTAATPEALATAEPAPATGDLDDLAQLAAAQPAPRDQLAVAEALKGLADVPAVARTTPLAVKVGDIETFWVSDQIANSNYQIKAKLRYAGPVVLMYVDTSVDVDQADIEKSAQEFEQKIYPRDRAIFGHELSPGIDGDPRLTILNTPVRGAGGYFSSADGVVKAVNRFSNEREMFVIGIDSYPLGSDGYASTLAHEFQHMIEWNVARRSPSWFNEGMSMLAQDLNGYEEDGAASQYLRNPDVQLTTWSTTAAQSGDHYGTSQLFLRYFYQQYGSEDGVAELIKADAGNNLQAFVPIAARKRPEIKSFADIYADWAVANAINDSTVDAGQYAYKLLPDRATLTPPDESGAQTIVNQFGVDYYGTLQGPIKISFDGAETVGLTGAQPKDGKRMWWSNRGDDSIETLTRAIDLSNLKQATLQFWAWYEIEKDWDYGFVTVSTDGGTHWTTLKGTTTTDDDPQAQNFGNGLTGVSGAPSAKTEDGTRGKWVEEKMDLTPYAGKQVLLRFWVVNDAAYNAQGLLLDDIRIPELNFSDGAEQDDAGWQAQGFVRTTGELPQTWALRLIRSKSGTTQVESVPVDAQGRAEVQLAAGERGLLAVIGTTPFTTEPATYSYTVGQP